MTDAEKIKMLTAALEEIKLGRGPYKQDPLEHADSCIAAMKRVASDALSGEYVPD